MKNIRPTRQSLLSNFMHSKKLIISSILIIALVVCGLYIWWSRGVWDNYTKKYSAVPQSIDSRLEGVFSLQSDTGEEKQIKLAALDSMYKDMTAEADSLCSPGGLVAWQAFLYKDNEKACRDVKGRFEVFNASIFETIGYLRSEQALAKQFGPITGPSEVSEAEFEVRLSSWRNLSESIKGTSGGERFENVKQVAIEVTGEITKAWEEVVLAHQAKDKARYTRATQNLAAAFDRLNEITVKDREQLSTLGVIVRDAYASLE